MNFTLRRATQNTDAPQSTQSIFVDPYGLVPSGTWTPESGNLLGKAYSLCTGSRAGTVTYVLGSPTAQPPLASDEIAGQEDRVRLVMSLLKHARHDFHRASKTHLFFCFYAANAAIRSFHPYKDRAFAEYVIQANRIAMSKEGCIRDWLQFITESASAVEQKPETPCSGVINFRLNATAQKEIVARSKDRALSLNRLSISAFNETAPKFRNLLKQEGVERVATVIRRFYDGLADEKVRQHTVRVGIETHALIISLAHELAVSTTAMSSYLVQMHLFGYQYESARTGLPYWTIRNS